MSVVSTRRSRATGTVVSVIDNRDGSFDDTEGELGWFTVCEDHSGVCSHPTRKLAERFAPVPDQWCPYCQDGQLQAGSPCPNGCTTDVEQEVPERLTANDDGELSCPTCWDHFGIVGR